MIQGASSARNGRYSLISSMFPLTKTELFANLIAVAALCDFLYLLPLLGDVFKQAGVFSLILCVVIAFFYFVSLINGGRINIIKLIIAYWMFFVFFYLYGLAPIKFVLCAGLVAILLLREEQQRLAFEKFQAIFCLIVLVNVLAYPLIVLGMLPSLGEIIPDHWAKQEDGVYFENFGISFALHGWEYSMPMGNLLLYRLNAWFAEPGNVGTMGALLLAATDFKMDWKGKVLLVGGFLSFSMAFFTMVFLYAAMKRPKIFLCLLGAFVLLAWYFQDNEFISSVIIDRLSISDEGIAADNRASKAFDLAFSKYAATPSVWLGHDQEHRFEALKEAASSWKIIVWEYGIVGAVLYLSVYIFIFFYSVLGRGSPKGWTVRLKQLLPFTLVFLGSIYQRPGVLICSYFLIFVGAMVWVKSDGKKYA